MNAAGRLIEDLLLVTRFIDRYNVQSIFTFFYCNIYYVEWISFGDEKVKGSDTEITSANTFE